MVLKPRGHRKPLASVGARGAFKAEPSMGWMALLGWLKWSRRRKRVPLSSDQGDETADARPEGTVVAPSLSRPWVAIVSGQGDVQQHLSLVADGINADPTMFESTFPLAVLERSGIDG